MLLTRKHLRTLVLAGAAREIGLTDTGARWGDCTQCVIVQRDTVHRVDHYVATEADIPRVILQSREDVYSHPA